MAQEPAPITAEFREHLLRIADVDEMTLDKLIRELRSYWSEPVDAYVHRRHRELQRAGVSCRAAYPVLADEVAGRPFGAGGLSERQVRRLLYG